ncbi:MAG: DUF1573 domain-containing protein [Kiritimatiellae bacterium]|nr:DUF1573 domain-containing protein [Kiritimatiellia bacterium]
MKPHTSKYLITSVLLAFSALSSMAHGILSVVGPDTVDVGVYDSSNLPPISFTLRNTGDAPLHLTHVVSTCRCLTLGTYPKQLLPGAKGTLTCAVNTEETKGEKFCGTVMIENNSQQTPFSHVTVKSSLPWNRSVLYRTPRVFPATEYRTNGMETIFYEGEPFKGKPTRVFAYLGMPAVPPGQKVPGIVLVHGGGGSAFYRWVKLWNSRGYAAISMDTCGAISGNTVGNEQRAHYRHDYSGPAGWGDFKNAEAPVTDQWTYHAVAAVIRGHSLLRAQPNVDPARIGITGISWGGYLTCIAASVDDRFAFAVPVYGCGFLDENSAWKDNAYDRAGVELGTKWAKLWDPRHFLPLSKTPFLWVDGSNDFAYPMDSLQKSYRCLAVPYSLCVRLRMPHGHGAAGENPAEILAFANQMVRGGKKLPSIGPLKRNGAKVSASYSAGEYRIKQAILNYTTDSGRWQKRLWKETPAIFDPKTVTAELPPNTTVYYLNLVTEENLVISSQHEELPHD